MRRSRSGALSSRRYLRNSKEWIPGQARNDKYFLRKSPSIPLFQRGKSYAPSFEKGGLGRIL
jgi:hypothetical protein